LASKVLFPLLNFIHPKKKKKLKMIFKGQKKERKIKTQENIQQKNKITG